MCSPYKISELKRFQGVLVPVVEVALPKSPEKIEIPKVYKISFQVSKTGPVKIERIVSESENETPIDLRIMK